MAYGANVYPWSSAGISPELLASIERIVSIATGPEPTPVSFPDVPPVEQTEIPKWKRNVALGADIATALATALANRRRTSQRLPELPMPEFSNVAALREKKERENAAAKRREEQQYGVDLREAEANAERMQEWSSGKTRAWNALLPGLFSQLYPKPGKADPIPDKVQTAQWVKSQDWYQALTPEKQAEVDRRIVGAWPKDITPKEPKKETAAERRERVDPGGWKEFARKQISYYIGQGLSAEEARKRATLSLRAAQQNEQELFPSAAPSRAGADVGGAGTATTRVQVDFSLMSMDQNDMAALSQKGRGVTDLQDGLNYYAKLVNQGGNMDELRSQFMQVYGVDPEKFIVYEGDPEGDESIEDEEE